MSSLLGGVISVLQLVIITYHRKLFSLVLIYMIISQYQKLERLRQEWPDVPIIALTATAEPRIVQDVISKLGLKNHLLVQTSVNRPNLRYTVVPKPAATRLCASIKSWIENNHPNQPGIIYCLSRKNCEELAEKLWKDGIRAYHYHAGLSQEEKNDILRKWQGGKLQVIVATVSNKVVSLAPDS